MRGSLVRGVASVGATLTLAAAWMGATAVSAPAGTDVPTGSVQPDGVHEFFAIEAESGALEERDGERVLTLRDVDRDAALFSERPEPLSGAVPVRRLVNRWDEEGLTDDPPIAVVTVLDGAGAGATTAFELSDPTYSDGDASFVVEEVDSLDGEPLAPDVAAIADESTEPVPDEFGSATLLVDPENDIMQYCFARVINRSGTGIAGKGTQLIFPTSAGIKQLSHDEEKTVSSSGTFACNINYVFRAGAGSGWGFAMAAATGEDNVSTCDRHCKRTVTHDTSTYRVTFELLKP